MGGAPTHKQLHGEAPKGPLKSGLQFLGPLTPFSQVSQYLEQEHLHQNSKLG